MSGIRLELAPGFVALREDYYDELRADLAAARQVIEAARTIAHDLQNLVVTSDEQALIDALAVWNARLSAPTETSVDSSDPSPPSPNTGLLTHRFSGDPWGPCSQCEHPAHHRIHWLSATGEGSHAE
jgi:hypothetical protein